MPAPSTLEKKVCPPDADAMSSVSIKIVSLWGFSQEKDDTETIMNNFTYFLSNIFGRLLPINICNFFLFTDILAFNELPL